MADKKPTDITVAQKGGVVRNVVNQFKLIFRLMGDSRVNILAKLIPVGAIAYFILPADLLPGLVFPGIGALDDAAVLWLGSTLFTELCPPAVVEEHVRALAGTTNSVDAQGEVVDAETTDLSDRKPE
jgi:uncharacterized membrane protein YkvA (DUF1232 family)